MGKSWKLGILLLVVGSAYGGGWFCLSRNSASESVSIASSASPQPTLLQNLHYQEYSFSKSTVYTLRIPPQSRYWVVPAISETVDQVERFAHKAGAIAAINGGFFDPMNQKSTSYIVLQGKQVADPKQNERLVTNPDLAPYLNQIFDRSEFRRYQCGQAFQYAITRHSSPVPDRCQLLDALGGGPQLLPQLTAVPEGFVAMANGVISRDSLGSHQPNARSAIGITHDGSVVWVMVAQKPNEPANSGMSFQELTGFMQTLGVEQALNLDGGSSSALYYQGKTVYGKVNQQGERVQRSVKSVLLVLEHP